MKLTDFRLGTQTQKETANQSQLRWFRLRSTPTSGFWLGSRGTSNRRRWIRRQYGWIWWTFWLKGLDPTKKFFLSVHTKVNASAAPYWSIFRCFRIVRSHFEIDEKFFQINWPIRIGVDGNNSRTMLENSMMSLLVVLVKNEGCIIYVIVKRRTNRDGLMTFCTSVGSNHPVLDQLTSKVA